MSFILWECFCQIFFNFILIITKVQYLRIFYFEYYHNSESFNDKVANNLYLKTNLMQELQVLICANNCIGQRI